MSFKVLINTLVCISLLVGVCPPVYSDSPSYRSSLEPQSLADQILTFDDNQHGAGAVRELALEVADSWPDAGPQHREAASSVATLDVLITPSDSELDESRQKAVSPATWRPASGQEAAHPSDVPPPSAASAITQLPIEPDDKPGGESAHPLTNPLVETTQSPSPQGAISLTYGQTVTGTIATPGQVVTYTFNGGVGHQVTAFVDNRLETWERLSLRLTNPDGSSLAYCDFTDGDCEIDNVTLPTTGVYTLIVDGQGDDTGDYTLALNRLDGDEELISYGQSLDRSISPMGDQDSYTFNGGAGHRVTAFVDNQLGTWERLSLRLTNPDGSSLAYCDFTDGDCEIDNVTLPTTGVYTLIVDGQGDDTGDYTLALNRLDGDEEPISYGQSLDRSISPMGDQDSYTFNGGAGHRVTAFVDNQLGTWERLSLRLTNPDGSSLAYCDFTDGDCEIEDVTLPTTGVYTLIVDGQGDDTGDYTLALNRATFAPLTLGVSYTDTLIHNADVDWYWVEVGADEHLSVQVSKDTAWYGSLYIRYGALPMESEYDARSYRVQGNQAVDIPVTQGGTYYIMLRGGYFSPAYGNYTIIANAVTTPPLPIGEPQDVSVTGGTSSWFQIEVPSSTTNLFVTLQKYSSWSGELKLYSGSDVLASVSGHADQILQLPSPTPGTYLLEVSGAGSGQLTALTALPPLPLGQWVVGTILRKWGSVWYQCIVPPDQDSLFINVETIGLWSQLKVYRGAFDTTPYWFASGPTMNLEIPSPEPDVYYVHLTDSAWIQGDDQTRDHMIRADVVPIEPPPCTDPVVANVAPTKGGTAGPVTVIINGQCLDPEATVCLARQGHSDVCAEAVTGDEDDRALSATFDLSGTEPGEWTLVVTNPALQSAAAPTPFTVESGGEAQLWIEIIGREQIRVGRQSTYVVRVENVGTLDTVLTFAFFSLPQHITCLEVRWRDIVVWDHTKDADSPVAFAIKPLSPDEELVLETTLLATTATYQGDRDIGAASPSAVAGFVVTGIVVPELTSFAQSFLKHKWDECVQEPVDQSYYINWGAAFKNAFDEWKEGHSPKAIAEEKFWDSVFDRMMEELLDEAAKKALKKLRGRIFSLLDWGKALKENIEKNPNTHSGGETTKPVQPVTSISPEDKYGPSGWDVPGTPAGELQRWIPANRTLDYRIDFWNKEDAPAATLDVVVTDQLDSDLDWTTFKFTEIGFLDWRVELEPCQYFNVDVENVSIDLSQYYPGEPVVNLVVNVEGIFDPATGTIEWQFHALDLATRQPPDNPFAGFLPPITDSGWEIGWVAFSVSPKPGLTSGTVISNQSYVKFDVDQFKPAPPEGPFVNTLDAIPPTSSVQAPTGTQQCNSFLVTWAGQDDPNGSGLRGFDVYVDDLEDEESAYLWQIGTTDTSALFTGLPGHRYGFYARAHDNVGNVESIPEPFDFEVEATAGTQCGVWLPLIMKGSP